MKELSVATSNLTLIPLEDGSVRGMVEVVLVLSESVYTVTEEGEIGQDRQCETLRFMATPDGLRGVAGSFMEWADDMEAFAAKHTRVSAMADAMTRLRTARDRLDTANAVHAAAIKEEGSP